MNQMWYRKKVQETHIVKIEYIRFMTSREEFQERGERNKRENIL